MRAQGSWVRQAARDAGVPIFVVKSAAPSNLTRALRTLLGFDPSAGGTFAGWRERVRRESSTGTGAKDALDSPDASFAPAQSSNVSPRVSVCKFAFAEVVAIQVADFGGVVSAFSDNLPCTNGYASRSALSLDHRPLLRPGCRGR